MILKLSHQMQVVISKQYHGINITKFQLPDLSVLASHTFLTLIAEIIDRRTYQF
ncbi:hypothetical protein C8R11_109111 [Nitrosomonas aestuarii]|nr:hypothetical protein C8R11_109111 [Nitrosomonas aestuarii]